ncbi:MAG: two-component sensor histidine kinase [Thermomonas hydrothermalis]|uniref:ATP-binding protein n=1 Tax=Thermomonas hydrothermalis TaxID=213588 RepID=UPI002357587C|nr:ATP-binding protein [Thermomonas hydrothermalis]MCL6619647.1 two-component sensor histidine kinase [Thermomonas hydrothermalis]
MRLRLAQPRSLQSRQLWAASVGLVAFLALAGFALDGAFQRTAQSGLRERLHSYALAYANSDFARDGSVIPPWEPPDARFRRPGSGLYAQIVLENGMWESESAQGPELPPAPMLPPGKQVFEGPLPFRQINGAPGMAYRFGYGLTYAHDDDEGHDIRYTVYVLEDSTALARQVAAFRAALWWYLGGAGVILLLLQMFVLRWSLRPLHDVILELKRVQRGEASGMSQAHPRELAPLTESINAFIQSERENLERQRNTLADLAHSLKTPLAVLRTRLESGASEAELRQELDTQLRRMNDLVSYQLARAARSGHVLFSAPIEIEPQAEQIVVGLEKVYASKGVLCEFDIDPKARFHGETGDLQELLGNLLENAFKWAKSRVLLTVRELPVGPERRPGLSIAVEDDGPGIQEDRIPLILQRGVRGDQRVQGHGIGLSIVQDILKSYRGELHVGRSQELGGARFEAVFPGGL